MMTRRELDRAARRIFAGGRRRLREGRAASRTFTDVYRPEVGVVQEATARREDGRLEDVALLGRISENNRVYRDQALSDAARLYRGAPMYIDHPTAREMRDRDGVRSVRDLAGRIENPRVAGEQVRGDVALLDTPVRDVVLDLAERMPQLVGFSHRARGEVRVDEDGTQVVESLDHVYGVELVSEPASTSGLFEALRESRGGGRIRRPRRSLDEEVWRASWQMFV